MASRAQTAQTDDNQFDDLFDYDVDTEIPDLDVSLDVPGQKKNTKKVNLGVDEELKITRVKRPTVKLDAERLLSPLGLPKLRRTAPEQLGKKLKGKGHEYSDAKRILNFYQLWADDLYRKANFRDTISIVEKLGHTKRVQIARNQYLDDYLPKNIPQEIAEEIARQENANNERAQNDDDDLYTEGPRKQGTSDQMQGENGGSLFLGGVDSDDEPSGAQPDDAELDALLEEEESEARMLDAGPTAPKAIGKQSTGDDEFDEFGDGLEAIDDWDEVMDGAGPSMQSQSQTADVGARASIFGGTTTEKPSNAGTAPPDDVDDEDALEALYGF